MGLNIVKEAGIPDWGGRLVLQLQNAIAGLLNQITNLPPDGQFIGFVGAGPIKFRGSAFIHWNG
jgi:hypothetical protein